MVALFAHNLLVGCFVHLAVVVVIRLLFSISLWLLFFSVCCCYSLVLFSNQSVSRSFNWSMHKCEYLLLKGHTCYSIMGIYSSCITGW
ncbi:hypothetical protein S245_031816 [Arachis hypogaea]